MPHTPHARDALLFLLRALRDAGYDFVTPTPATHARVLARADRREARTLRDIFGWSLPFAPDLLAPALIAALDSAAMLERRGLLLASRVRVSQVHGTLFLHSAFPTADHDAVFLGPDTYRFADFIVARPKGLSPGARVVDLGTGAGVGAVVAGGLYPGAQLTLVDINPDALSLAEINAAFAGLAVTTVLADGLATLDGPFDLVLANPPFIIDPAGRAYRDGGTMHGARLSLDWAVAATRRLAPGGRLLLYTGSAIVAGRDALKTALQERCAALGCTLDYREIDPDIFGEELDAPAYGDVERIAAVAIVMTREG